MSLMARKVLPKDKLNKSTLIICLIYFSMAQFNDNIKFWWRNLNINDLMLINLHISLITKLFFRSFDRQSDKTVTHSELLLDINCSCHPKVSWVWLQNCTSYYDICLESRYFYFNTRLWRQSIASGHSITSRFSAILLLSPPSYILYTLVLTVKHRTCY